MEQLAYLGRAAYEIAKEAGEAIMALYRQNEPIIPEYKSDASPLTIADKASHEIIERGLAKLMYQGEALPILSEEGRQIPFVERQGWQHYWCVDPLDGTKDFLKRNDEFTVNIALISNHQPVLGIIYVPAQQKGYFAWSQGGAFCCDTNGDIVPIGVKRLLERPLRVVVSRYHGLESLQPWIGRLGEIDLIRQGSSLKFCTLAKGDADIFLRLSPSSEWDNAAGQCLLEESGGQIHTLDGQSLFYNRSGVLEQRPFIAIGDTQLDWQRMILR